MSHTIPKLHKVGEYGHGKTVLVISSSSFFKDGIQADFINRLSGEPKIFLYSFDLYHEKFEGEELSYILESLTNTINKFHFAKTIIIDYLVFAFLVSHIHKIELFQKGFENLIIVNPVNSFARKYKTLLGEEIFIRDLPKQALKDLKLKIIELKGAKIDIISLQDLIQSVKLSSQIKNSRLHKAKTSYDVLDKIVWLISDEKI